MSLSTITLSPSMSYADLMNALNQNFALLENTNRTLVIRDNTGTPRIVIGYLANGF